MYNQILKLWKKADGNKTYIVTFVTAAYNFSVEMGWISHNRQVAINSLLGSAIVMAVRSAMSKIPTTTPTV
jgi:hypothetical protein